MCCQWELCRSVRYCVIPGVIEGYGINLHRISCCMNLISTDISDIWDPKIDKKTFWKMHGKEHRPIVLNKQWPTMKWTTQ
jgi:hypothetical protein